MFCLVGIIMMGAFALHAVLFLVPQCVGAVIVCVTSARAHRPAMFWGLSAAIAIAATAVRFAILMAPWIQEGKVYTFTALSSGLMNVPLVVTSVLAVGLAFATMSPRFRKSTPCMALLLGVLGSFPLQTAATLFLLGPLLGWLGVETTY